LGTGSFAHKMSKVGSANGRVWRVGLFGVVGGGGGEVGGKSDILRVAARLSTRTRVMENSFVMKYPSFSYSTLL
jgi:hypothetical protein